MDVAKLLAEIGGEQATTFNKVASAGSGSMEKLAEELDAAGRLMADSMADRFVERLMKLAEGSATSSHSHADGQQDGIHESQDSNWNSLARKIQVQHAGRGVKGDPSRSAERYYPNVARGAVQR